MWRSGLDKDVSVAIAFCPHLGARLTPEYGGKLIDGMLVCPFHGFRYDGSGTCIATARASEVPPKNCRLKMIPVREANGIILGYHGGKPRFDVPVLNDDGWTSKSWGSASVHTHIQEVVENVVDLNHFCHVHGYTRVDVVDSPTIDNCHFTTSTEVSARLNVPLMRHIGYSVDIEFHLWGLGYFFWESYSPKVGLRTRHWVLCVPDNDDLTLHYAVSVGDNDSTLAAPLKILPGSLRRWLIRRLVLNEMDVTIQQDTEIWNGKSYREKPHLIPSDGAIFKYRQFCQEFY